MISSDEEKTFSDGVSIISSELEENMMDVEAQLMAMDIEAQLSTPVVVRGRQMTLGNQDDPTMSSTPLRCGGPYSGYPSMRADNIEGHTIRRHTSGGHQPMASCCNLIPFVGTPLSPPMHERGFLDSTVNDLLAPCSQAGRAYVGVQTSVPEETGPQSSLAAPNPTPAACGSSAHFPMGQQMQVSNGVVRGYFTDCMICGKPYEQRADEIVIDYIHHTEYPGEPYYIKEARRRAFIEGMHAGTYFLIPRGVFLAAACDGNVYAIPQGTIVTNAIPTNLPLL